MSRKLPIPMVKCKACKHNIPKVLERAICHSCELELERLQQKEMREAYLPPVGINHTFKRAAT